MIQQEYKTEIIMAHCKVKLTFVKQAREKINNGIGI